MGIAGKIRPCLLLTDYPADDELAMAHATHPLKILGKGLEQ